MTLSKTVISLALCLGILATALAAADRSRGGLSSSQGGGFEIESDRRISDSLGSSQESSSGGRHSSGLSGGRLSDGGLSGGRLSDGGLSGGRHGGLDSLSGGYQSSGGSLNKLRGNTRGSEHSDTRRH